MPDRSMALAGTAVRCLGFYYQRINLGFPSETIESLWRLLKYSDKPTVSSGTTHIIHTLHPHTTPFHSCILAGYIGLCDEDKVR